MAGPAGLGKRTNDQILDSSEVQSKAKADKGDEYTEAPAPPQKVSQKVRDDMERDRVRKRERKALLKSLQMA